MQKIPITVKTHGSLIGWIVLFPLLYACTQQIVQPPTPLEDITTSQDYQLGSEDSVEVQVWKNPDLSRTVTVRPDGKISLPLIGDVQAGGRTATQLTEAITEKLKAYYKDPAQVTVIVNPVNSYVIYMLGEIRSQGKHTVRSGTTFLQAIALAGGFTQFASTNKITVRRKSDDGKEIIIPMRYKDILAGVQENIILKPGDTIIAP